MNYGEVIDHEGIKQTPWFTLANGDELCYLVRLDKPAMRYVLVTGHGYENEKETKKQESIADVLKEMRV